jgi:hypothetical protein
MDRLSIVRARRLSGPSAPVPATKPVLGALRLPWHQAVQVALVSEHPVKQFVLELCLYAQRLAQGELCGEPPEYRSPRAERYVREQRMPADLFRRRLHLSDEELAEAFNVPVWEVAARRLELETTRRARRWSNGGAVAWWLLGITRARRVRWFGAGGRGRAGWWP